MVMNFAFTEGNYTGSSISILGRNPIMVFKESRGNVMAHTYWFDAKTGDAIVEYNAYVRYTA
ncbi:Dirigent protein 22 [Linum perenne]